MNVFLEVGLMVAVWMWVVERAFIWLASVLTA
jgi:hypothetical protein